MNPTVTLFTLTPQPLVDHDGCQRFLLHTVSDRAAHATVRVRAPHGEFEVQTAFASGDSERPLLFPAPPSDGEASAELCFGGETLRYDFSWKKPRDWTFFVMVSSHTDIGLHNSQYYQRHNTQKLLDDAMKLCDETESRPENDRYRYTMEGTWFFENYPADRSKEEADNLIENYVKKGKIGLCCGTAGNHTQVFGYEELCRAAYGRKRMLETYGVDTETMTMIDNNGLSWPIVQPFADAGTKNLIFSPNHWNPLLSEVWDLAKCHALYKHDSDYGVGGSRVDVRWHSALPMLFRWLAADGHSEMTVWASTIYGHSVEHFGFDTGTRPSPTVLARMEKNVPLRVSELEARYPIDTWLLCAYQDDQQPDLSMTDTIAAWNKRWKTPAFRTLGDPNEPFRRIAPYLDRLPVLRGDITGGWYQHPLSAAALLADKLNADRRLADAEKVSAAAALTTGRPYPAVDLDRAWKYLIMNDEHSYGVSGYQGRRVYETWMQHRDWIEKASGTANAETAGAMKALADRFAKDGELFVFNPTALSRSERILLNNGECFVENIPAFGWKTLPLTAVKRPDRPVRTSAEPPVVENRHYRVSFREDGSVGSIYDKSLTRELLDPDAPYGANGFVYTDDNHKTFHTTGKASFTVEEGGGLIVVTTRADEPLSGAAVVSVVTLDENERRVTFDDHIAHMRSMVNDHRYYRYLYYAFPFAVENCRRFCQLNGVEAEYASDLTGHGTDVYMAAHEWCCAENADFGAALMQLDTNLVEFDRIHPDKTDYADAGEGSAVYSYVSNDWLQMHLVGGSHVEHRLRYAVTSYAGSHRAARLAEEAERFAFPVIAAEKPGVSDAPVREGSFLSVPDGQRLVGVKRADDGNGLIVRLLGDTAKAAVDLDGSPFTIVGTDETERPVSRFGAGYSTLRVGAGLRLPVREPAPDLIGTDVPAPVGSVYTGLITKPKAARGENNGHLYLIWGQNREADLSHYELYRSTDPDFVPSDVTFLAKVEPGEYRVGLYVDEGLADHTAYYYRVRAVNRSGKAGAFSEVFSGITKEPIQ